MKFSNKSIVALMIFSMKVFHATASEDAAVPLVITSTQEKRLLNTCETFQFVNGNWYVDGDANDGQTLEEACDPNLPGGLQLDCCRSPNGIPGVNIDKECKNWNTALPYTLCKGACQGSHACYNIAQNAQSGSVKINSNACQGTEYACHGIGLLNYGENVVIEVGTDSCQGDQACQGIAGNASGGSIRINSNACTSDFNCSGIGATNLGHLDVEIGSGACDSPVAVCSLLGHGAEYLTRIEIPPNECKETVSDNGFTWGKCQFCGFHSAFEGTFHATDACCEADGIFGAPAEDLACNGSQAPSNLPSSIPSNLPSSIPSDLPSAIPSDIHSDQPSSVPSSMPSDIPSDIASDQPSSVPSSMPSDIPSDIPSDQPSSVPSSMPSDIPSDSPSDQPSSVPSPSKSPPVPPVEPASPCANQTCNNKAGKCEVTSTTDFKCVCEDTFINTSDERNCVCPPGFIRKLDNRCYDPTTPSPIPLTKAPTASPVIKTLESSSPTKLPTDDCNDDEDAKFYLIKKPSKSVKCSWLTKNTDRADERIANYCGLNRVKNICKSTCSFCTCDDDDSFTFELNNVSDPTKKTQTCDWLTRNQKNSATRISRYCTKDFDDGSVMNACTKSCGLCDCADDDSFTFELINISDPNKKIQTCDWLTANENNRVTRIERYCTEKFDDGAVVNACTKSCGLCG